MVELFWRAIALLGLLVRPFCLKACESPPVFLFLAPCAAAPAAPAEAIDVFQAAQDTFARGDRPQSALFQKDAGSAQPAVGSGWFLLGMYIIIALLFSGLSAYTAVSKGLNPVPYFFVGFLFSLLGYLYVLSRPSTVKPGAVPAGLVKVPTTQEPVPCPHCGYTNHPAAKKCLGCGAALQPLMQSEVNRARGE